MNGWLQQYAPYANVSSDNGGSWYTSIGSYYNGATSLWARQAGWILPVAMMKISTVGDIGFFADTATSGVPSWSTRLILRNDGNVGVGTASPSSLFSVGASSQFQVDGAGNVVAGNVPWARLSNVPTNSVTTDGMYQAIPAVKIFTQTAAANDANQLMSSWQGGTDVTLGPVAITVGVHPSAAAANRYGYIQTGDNAAVRPTVVNGPLGVNTGAAPVGMLAVGIGSPFQVDATGNVITSGKIGVGVTALSSAQMEVRYATQNLAANASGTGKAHLALMANETTIGAGNGAALGFGGKYTSGGGQILWAAISGNKTSATDVDANGYLGFHTWTANPSYGLAERMRIDHLGRVGIGTVNPQATLDVTDQTVVGTDLVTNGGFATDTVWSKATGWTIASGVAHFDGTGTGLGIQEPLTLVVGKMYKVTYTVVAIGGATVHVLFTGGSLVAGTSRSTTGTYTDYLVAGSGNNVVYFETTASVTVDLDNVSVQEVTGGNVLARGLFTGGGASGIKVDALGNVGIGTTTPSGTLDVAGTVRSTGTNNVLFTGSSSGDRSIQIAGAGTIQAANYAQNSSQGLYLNPSGGNVGIGTLTAGGVLTVYSNANTFNEGGAFHVGNEAANNYYLYGGVNQIGKYAYLGVVKSLSGYVTGLALQPNGGGVTVGWAGNNPSATPALDVGDPGILGAELVTNGTFAADASWTKSTGWTIAGGVAHQDGTGVGTGLSQIVTLTAGKLYKVVWTAAGVSGIGCGFGFLGGTNIFAPTHTANGTFSELLVAVTGNNTLFFGNAGAGGICDVDNVSLKEVTGGNVVARGLFTGGGTAGIKVDAQGVVTIGNPNTGNDVTITTLNHAVGFDPTLGPTQLVEGVHTSATGANRFGFIGIADGAAMRPLALNSQGTVFGKVGIGTITPHSMLAVVGLSVYVNNAAAVAAGLAAGDLYRTGADPDPVMVVH